MHGWLERTLTNVPWPSSVWAYVPMICSALHFGRSSFCCSSDAWPWIAGMNICTAAAPMLHMLTRFAANAGRAGICMAIDNNNPQLRACKVEWFGCTASSRGGGTPVQGVLQAAGPRE